jgi:hypothetical protein
MTREPITEAARFAALDALLKEPRASWAELMTLLAWWPASQGQEQAVALAEAAAGRWQDGQRDLPRIGMRHLLENKVPPYLRLLRTLDMMPLWRASDRARLLARMIHEAGMRRLHSFSIRYDDGPAIVRELVRHVEGLGHLYLGTCSVGDRELIALARCPAMAGLHGLSLHGNHITDKGALALLSSPYLRQISYLNLYKNRISPGVVAQLQAAPWWQGDTLLLNAQRG